MCVTDTRAYAVSLSGRKSGAANEFSCPPVGIATGRFKGRSNATKSGEN